MRLNADVNMRGAIDVYLNGQKEPNAVEVYVPGNVLEGRGYVVRGVTKNGKQVAVYDLKEPLRPGQYDHEGALCEKIFGQIRIVIAECFTEFPDE